MLQVNATPVIVDVLDYDQCIAPEAIEKAITDTGSAVLKETLGALDSDETKLLKLIAKTEKKNSGELYDLFKKETGLSYTKFYRMLDKFESIRIIDTKFSEEGKRGRTRNVILRYEKDEILK